jgi:hypothetical protein
MAARADAIAAGVPARAWAAVVLIGDGTMTPFRAGAATGGARSRTMLLLVLASLAAGGGLAFARRNRARPT